MGLQSILTNTITVIFLIIILSYYFLLIFKRRKKPSKGKKYSSITIIMPAHNEERYIAESIHAVLDAKFNGKKEIIVVDDGSKDKTYSIAKKISKKDSIIKVIKQKHSGKSKSINNALKIAKGELIAVVDSDSIISRDSFIESLKYINDKNVAAVCSTIKVANRKSFLGMWLHMEQLYNSLLRDLFARVNVNIVAPGPLSVYKKNFLKEIGGFGTKGFSEDVDIAIRFIKKGYLVTCADKSISATYLPIDTKGFLKQRTRYAKGWLNIFGRHLRLNKTFIQIYTLPIMFFGYFQAVIMGIITVYNLITGYITYFASQGIYFSWGVAKFFFEWFSIVGIIKWFIRIASGSDPLTVIAIIGICSSLLIYPLYLLAIFKYDKKFDLLHLIPLIFMFPFWFVLMIIYIINLPEVFNKNQKNIWHKETVKMKKN